MTIHNSNAITGVLLLCTTMSVSVSTPAMAQEDDVLDEIVVTATRRATAVRDVARSISVVDKDRIQIATQQLGLDEALSGVPGLYMQNRYNFAQDLRISLRGFGARSSFGIRGIKVIVDGIPETLPDGQSGVDSIDIGSIQSIEILRGPASSLYGNASGGVIAVSSELGSSEPFVEGRIAGGKHGYSQLQFKSAGKAGNSDYLFNVSRSEIDGYRELSRTVNNAINTKLGVPLQGSDKLIFVLNLTDQPEAQDAGGVNAAQALDDPTSARDLNIQFDAGESLEQQRIGVVYQRNRPAGDLTLRNYYAFKEFSNRLPFVGGGSVNFDRLYYGVGAQYDIGSGLPKSLDLTVGADLDRQDDHRQRFDNNNGVLGPRVFNQDEMVDSKGVYLQARYEISAAWAVLGGLRYDEISYDITDRFLSDGNDSGALEFSATSPSLALNYKTGAGVLFASYSSSFETPTTTELANPDASGGFNRSLEPQIADHFELGYKYSSGNVYYELAGFTIDLRDELIPFELAAFPGRTFFSNAGSSTRDGIEAAFAWENRKGLRVDASYTWSDFQFDKFIDDSGNDYGGNRLPGLPERFANIALSYQSDNGTTASLDAFHSGGLFANNANTVDIPSYTVANLRLAHEFQKGNWLVRPYFGINNLLDENYNSNIRINAFGGRYFEPAPERHFYAGVVVNFSKAP